MDVTRRSLLRVFTGAAAAATLAANPVLADTSPGNPSLAGSGRLDRFKGYGQAIDLARHNRANFLLMYDTNHMNRAMNTYPLETGALDAAQKRGVKHIFLELMREFQPAMDACARGETRQSDFVETISSQFFMMRMDDVDNVPAEAVLVMAGQGVAVVEDKRGRDEYLNRLGRGLREAHQRGIKIWGADAARFASLQGRLNHDHDIADYIASKAGGDLSVITYGALHGAKARRGQSEEVLGGGLDDELARHGRVMTLELRETNMPDLSTRTGAVQLEARHQIQALADRSPQFLNIDTGEFRSDPVIDNTHLRGRPRGRSHPRPLR